MTRCRPEIRTYHLSDDERMRYVLSHGRGFALQLPGIRQWMINWFTSPMTINKITPPVDKNYWFKDLSQQVRNQPIKIQLKSQRLLIHRIKQCGQTLGTSFGYFPPCLLPPWCLTLKITKRLDWCWIRKEEKIKVNFKCSQGSKRIRQ